MFAALRLAYWTYREHHMLALAVRYRAKAVQATARLAALSPAAPRSEGKVQRRAKTVTTHPGLPLD